MVGMRNPDDDVSGQGADGGSLADGLGETAGPGEYSSTSDPFGDGDLDDPHDDDDTTAATGSDDTDVTDGDGTFDTDGGTGTDDDTYDTGIDDTVGSDTGTDETNGSDRSDDGTFGDGETDAGGDSGGVFDGGSSDRDDDGSVTSDGGVLDGTDLLAQDASPLEGIGFLLDELHDALLGDDDEAALIEQEEAAFSQLDQDPADIASDSDLDLTGDGVVDGADLHEARSVFDFEPGQAHEG
jgi:hypothetical protein